ncbi:CDP-diacylglycerol--glycerol-3-phosphate 3-phosphatidyltransferase [Endomicrobium proavitum]|uniref:CDP-diacylglycerol--glycerol-3-phosphate 3-phosphatidyltransferase n=1 Tax=Endomicrobium proavitum TaxID=1408281 RepID=A0A0G3WI37_9BACT|nr:CDP-diacylglycerol--glycerol-3-phosphate 3-phosphatidyltransferase [Endomicrobium proavitum]AKL97953.1 CDP-diacylglycerol-glycerol-3-phosphate 3-phosphatidyltransferase [Endomicrobium proavitum]
MTTKTMNLANRLTVARIIMVPFFILFMELDGFWFAILALIIFSAASITDYFDGKIARKQNTITSLGIFLDPLADKLLISAAFICFVNIAYLNVPAWMVVAIIAREFLITGLRSIAAAKNVIIPADKSGKFKTTSQIVVIILLLLIIILNETLLKFYGVSIESLRYTADYHSLGAFLCALPMWSVLIAAILTIYSGLHYILKHRKLLIENE